MKLEYKIHSSLILTAGQQENAQTELLKLTPEILDITHHFQTILKLKKNSKKLHKSKKNKQSERSLELEKLYVMSTEIEKTCQIWQQKPLENKLIPEYSSSIFNFFYRPGGFICGSSPFRTSF